MFSSVAVEFVCLKLANAFRLLKHYPSNLKSKLVASEKRRRFSVGALIENRFR